MKFLFAYTAAIIFCFQSHGFAAPINMIGAKGMASEVNRIIKVKMYDNYYEPKVINIKKGETVKFVVENKGLLVHEFNIATIAMHKMHEPEMLEMMKKGILLPNKIDKKKMKQMSKKNQKMSHSHSNSVLLEPNQNGVLIWKFTSKTDLYGGCNVPGHLEAGMISKINVN
mgnify:CR=1 FL=1|tara:strand:- start:2255 stop:2764 length:510 start_codon:yes stop_codon:yes gene_type:complete